jgi:hypothetical protein
MAAFCEKCGFPQSATSAFCPQCGNRQSAGTPGPAPLAPANTGSGLKILFVVLGCFALAGVVAIGGLFYVGHKVKQAVVQKAAENGVDLSSISSPVSHRDGPAPRLRQPCDYLSKDEVSRLIGQPLERAEVRDAMCFYIGPEGLAAKLAQDQASKTFKKAQEPNAKVDGMEVANAVEQLAGNLGAQNAVNGTTGELPLLMVGLDADGRAQMTAVTAANAIFGGIFKAAGGKGASASVPEVPGLGDRAVRVPKLGLNVLKGEILIRIIPGPLPDANAKTIEVARAILPKI